MSASSGETDLPVVPADPDDDGLDARVVARLEAICKTGTASPSAVPSLPAIRFRLSLFREASPRRSGQEGPGRAQGAPRRRSSRGVGPAGPVQPAARVKQVCVSLRNHENLPAFLKVGPRSVGMQANTVLNTA